jgi:iron-sulfur cluster repair protein YtfE (RIC family)
MKATTLLIRQHNTAKALFKKLESCRPASAPALLKELSNDLAAHLVIEQEIFYPAVKKIDEDLIREGYEEHSLAELAIKRLLACDPASPSFKAHVTATKELIGHHVKEEQEDLFPKVEKKIQAEKLEEMGAAMKARFEELVAAGFAAAVPKGFAKTSSDMSLRRL